MNNDELYECRTQHECPTITFTERIAELRFSNDGLEVQVDDLHQQIAELEAELVRIRNVLSSQDKGCLGTGLPQHPDDGAPWPIVDEVIDSITKTLDNA